MGAPKQKWTPEEEAALRAGVEKHGAGKWRTIQKDPEFCPYLSTRSNIDLKDKWRNMSVSACGPGSREKLRTPKLKSLPSIPLPNSEISASPAQLKEDGLEAVKDSSRILQDGNSTPRYTSMIIEALSAIREPNGVEIGAICSFIERKYEVAPNFRRLLSSKLRRLVGQDRIEKVQNGYKLKESPLATKTPSPKRKDPPHRLKPPQHSGHSGSPNLEELAANAAYKIAEADAKSFLASEAAKEADRVSRLAEETDSLLLLASEIFERCTHRPKVHP